MILEQRNRFVKGESLEILSVDGELLNKTLKVNEMTDEKGEIIEDVKGVQQRVFVKTDLPLQIGDILRRKCQN